MIMIPTEHLHPNSAEASMDQSFNGANAVADLGSCRGYKLTPEGLVYGVLKATVLMA